MIVMLFLFGLGFVVEMCLYLPIAWRARKVLAASALILTAAACGMVAVWDLTIWSILVAGMGLYRIFNMLRIVEGRMHEQYLRRSARRTSVGLIGLQIFVAGCWLAWEHWHVTGHEVWTALAGVEVLLAVVLLASTIRRLRRSAWPARAPIQSDQELPTLTVAIPARNETEDLQACLTSLVQCNYPKLEILVLDDCSQTKRTPEIIRAFAHDGVRFMEGETPRETWLPKNQGYDHLARQANGDYLLFCGVDVRFGPDSLRQLIGTLQYKNKEMMSLLPWRSASAERRVAVIQAMRYAWELVPPRRLFNRPPVLSTCWIIRREALKRAGGFAAVTRSIVPEAHFARQLTASDGYSFMRASKTLGIESTKPAEEQYATAIRMRYPQMHRRPENVVLLTLAYLFGLVSPFVMAIAGFWVSIGLAAHTLSAAAGLLLVVAYVRVVLATRTGSWWFGLVALPFGLVYDLALLHISMWQYEFSVVDWKGRNICIPAMHVVPRLPRI